MDKSSWISERKEFPFLRTLDLQHAKLTDEDVGKASGTVPLLEKPLVQQKLQKQSVKDYQS